MDFAEFCKRKAEILDNDWSVLDLSETRVHVGMKNVKEEIDLDLLPAKAHRCHLAEHWLKMMGWSNSSKGAVFITRGVRHSLQVLMEFHKDKTWLLPSDVYPVYGKIARENLVKFKQYTSYPIGHLPDGDFLLFCHPSKPRTEPLNLAEEAMIEAWLKADKKRRIVIDAVYSYNLVDKFISSLFSTGQVIYLTSLSKSFLEEYTMGICFFMTGDEDLYRKTFQNLRWEDDHFNFRKAEYLLTQRVDIPRKVLDSIRTQNAELVKVLQEKIFTIYLTRLPHSYLHVLPFNWETLLQANNVLALPYSVFGGDPELDLCVVSSLRFA